MPLNKIYVRIFPSSQSTKKSMYLLYMLHLVVVSMGDWSVPLGKTERKKDIQPLITKKTELGT